MNRAELSTLVADLVAGEGGELVDLEVGGSPRKPVLRAYVDLPGGTTVGACAALSRKIEARLESAELVGERYVLEVSSPGLDRPLLSRRDFLRLRGRAVRVRERPSPGPGREWLGVLEEVGPEGGADFWIMLRPPGAAEPVRLEAGEIAGAKAHVGELTKTEERRGRRRGGLPK